MFSNSDVFLVSDIYYMNILHFLVPGMSGTSAHAFALQANDPHTMQFTLAILRLQESSVLDNLHRKWWETSNACSKEKDTSKSKHVYVH